MGFAHGSTSLALGSHVPFFSQLVSLSNLPVCPCLTPDLGFPSPFLTLAN